MSTERRACTVYPRAGPLIVIVDDRKTNRNIFARLAAAVDHDVEVEAFASPRDALSFIARHPPDLVISDYKMPEMDGAEFVRRLRENDLSAEIPIIVITAYDDRTFRLRALEAGATDFLRSPVDHSEFRTRARNLLRLRAQQKLLKTRADALEHKLQYSELSREKLLRDSREALAQVIDTVPVLITAADHQGRLIFANAMFASWAGALPETLVGRELCDVLGTEHGERYRELDRRIFEESRPLPSFEEALVDHAGRRHVFLTTKSPLRDAAGTVVGVLTTSLDINARKVAEAHLLHMAHHDALTDLPNRVLLQERLLDHASRDLRLGKTFALHLLDLDRFKSVNDALGHHCGDQLLRAVTQRLHGAVRATDTVARLGGDEFAIIQTDVGRPEDAGELAGRVVEILARPFGIEGREISISTSVGIALHPQDAVDPEDLLRKADSAMYGAKAAGRNGFRFYAGSSGRNAGKALLLEGELRRAISKEQFVLLYQPQISLATDRIIGVEALLRWDRPGLGLVQPAEFLPATEDTGLIVPLGEWVLHEACAQASVWHRAGLPPIQMGVNLSPVQFRRQDVRLLVTQVLDQSGLDPAFLDLELTESLLIEDIDSAAATLRRLKELGIRFSIDDFGTGYASLSYVKRLPIDRLKIDRSFLPGTPGAAIDIAIARAIINLGHSLGMRVIAEGVESPEQLRWLIAEGCDEAQGYYLGCPMRAEEVAAALPATARVQGRDGGVATGATSPAMLAAG